MKREDRFDNYRDDLVVEYRVTAVIKNIDQEEKVKTVITCFGSDDDGYELIGLEWHKLQDAIDNNIDQMFDEWLVMQDEKF